MKNVVIAVALLLAGYSLGTGLKPVRAQSFGVGPMVTSVTLCPPFGGLPAFCPVGSGTTGVWYTNFGSGWVLLVPTQTQAGVLTFNGRKPDGSGNIAPATGDYSYPQISGTMAFAWTGCPAAGLDTGTGLKFGAGCK